MEMDLWPGGRVNVPGPLEDEVRRKSQVEVV